MDRIGEGTETATNAGVNGTLDLAKQKISPYAMLKTCGVEGSPRSLTQKYIEPGGSRRLLYLPLSPGKMNKQEHLERSHWTHVSFSFAGIAVILEDSILVATKGRQFL